MDNSSLIPKILHLKKKKDRRNRKSINTKMKLDSKITNFTKLLYS